MRLCNCQACLFPRCLGSGGMTTRGGATDLVDHWKLSLGQASIYYLAQYSCKQRPVMMISVSRWQCLLRAAQGHQNAWVFLRVPPLSNPFVGLGYPGAHKRVRYCRVLRPGDTHSLLFNRRPWIQKLAQAWTLDEGLCLFIGGVTPQPLDHPSLTNFEHID